MFPVRSNFASAKIDDSGNDMNEVIEAGKELALWNRDVLNSQNKYSRNYSGIDAVAAMGRPKIAGTTLEEPLKFGGVTNPGAMAQNPMGEVRSDIYDRQSQPQEQPEVGMSNDNKLFWQRQDDNDIDSQLNRRAKEQNILKSQADIDAKGWKTVQIADPNDPTKQIWVRHNSITNETEPINLNNGNVQTAGQGKINAVDAEKAQEKLNKRRAIVSGAESSLKLLDDLLDENDKLKPIASRATGWSAAGNWIPGSQGREGSGKIARLAGRQVLDLINEMKAQSRTGATGFGQMNLKELELLQNSATMLSDNWQDDAVAQQALKEIKDRLKLVIQDGLDDFSENTVKPISSHSSSSSNTTSVPEGKILVRRKSDGKMGYTSKLTPEFEVVK